ncbi:L-sorbose 1-dehydrogenase-like isoform X2 [Parasteatoda tepidariorum]|uniref:L-sorbose 1-dehydrogenase-like isoform X2 n=1 Tax=Parasteatoda tepidariorum TaxID=114398 RepID=UPI0039BCE7FF
MTFISILQKFVFPFLLGTEIFNPLNTDHLKSHYDYIIVGAGSAGSVIASRLSEDECVKVLLLEAGPEAQIASEVPLAAHELRNSVNDWAYMSVPQKNGAQGFPNQQVSVPRGKGLGGSSSINYAIYTRGSHMDYDQWAINGATGWSWKEVFPYFKKSENMTDLQLLRNGYHGANGYLTVQTAQYESVIINAFADAAPEMGYKYRDTNGAYHTGFTRIQGTTRHGRRCSASKAFLIPAENRENLDIIIDALVTKILIDENNEAYGVKFEINDQEHEVYANKEVIICAGAFNSPHILMLSGIGHRSHLEEFGIPVIADLPVGDNLQNHVGAVGLSFEVPEARDLYNRTFSYPNETAESFLKFGKGPLTSLYGLEGMAWFNSKYNNASVDWPDLNAPLLGFTDASNPEEAVQDAIYNQVFKPYEGKNTFGFLPCYLRPKSRGTVRLASKNPRDAPLIDPNFFDHPEDLERVIEAMQFSVDIVTKTNAFRRLGAKMFTTKFPGCEQYEANSTYYSTEYLRCFSVKYTYGHYHPVGTCKMGHILDRTAVLDPQLRVKGIKNLRVVDGSIMPVIVGGNTNAPIIMIGEKASDMIKQDNPDRFTC